MHPTVTGYLLVAENGYWVELMSVKAPESYCLFFVHCIFM
jgi:hypothetical protein